MTRDDSDSDRSGSRLAFEAIGTSVWQALQRLNQGNLAALHLTLAYLQFMALSTSTKIESIGLAKSAFENYEKIEEDGVHSMGKDRRRHTLLTSIGILDSFLSDSLRFVFLFNPDEMPITEKRKNGESETDFVERIVRWSPLFSSQRKRIDFLSNKSDAVIDSDLLAELKDLTHLRNELAHHTGLYRFNKTEKTSEIWAEPKPLPEVTQESATKITVIVTEVCDTLLVAMCRKFFGNEPRVRPLTPEVAAVHQRFRREWAEKRTTTPVVEEFANTRWMIRELDEPNSLWVEDHASSFMIMPTGLEILPALISFRRNNKHGMNASISIDGRQYQELKNSKQVLEQMLEGKVALVEFHEESADEPKHARFSLEGFSDAWQNACRMREKKFPG